MSTRLPLSLLAFCLCVAPVSADTPWPFDLTHVRLRLTVDPKIKRLDGDVLLRLRARKAGVQQITLKAAGTIKVQGVTIGKRKLSFVHKAPKLTVKLAALSLAKGQQLELLIRYKVVGAKLGAYFIGPDQDYPDKPWQFYTQCEPYEGHYWFPSYHEPNDKATSEAIVRVPPGFSAISNGKLEGEQARGKWQTYHWWQKVPHSTYLISVMVGRYERRVIRSKHRVPMAYYVHKKDLADAPRSFSRTPEMMAFFEKLTGMPYPFSKYDQVVVEDYKWGGMEHSSCTTLSSRTIHDGRASLDVSSEGLVAHELAHQWYGDALTCKSFSHLWLNEGFATYFTHLWEARRHGEDRMRVSMQRARGWYMGAEDRGAKPVVRFKYKDAMSLFDGRSYGKGGWVLHMLRNVVGEKAFWKAIRSYTRRHWLKPVVTANLREAFEQASGQKLGWFFHQWLMAPGYPKFSVSTRYVGGELLLSVKQTQKGKNIPVFRMPVDVAVLVGNKRLTRRFELRKRSELIRWPLASRPRYVRFNDGGWILCRTDFKKSLKSLTLQAVQDTDVLGRLRAIERLAKHKKRLDAQEALGQVLRKDSDWGLRQKAAETLVAAGGPLALSYLRAAANDPSSKVRTAVAKGLRKFSGPEVYAPLWDILKHDKSYYAAAEALRSLVALRVKQSAKVLAEYRQTPSHQHLFRRTVLQCHADLGSKQDLAAVLAATKKGQPWSLREAAVGLLPRFSGKHGEQVRGKLLAMMTTPHFRTRRAAVRALGKLADPGTRSALERVAKHDTEQRVREAAKSALKAIEKKLAKGGNLARQAAQLKSELVRKRLEAERAILDLKILELRLKRIQIERKLEGK